MTKKPSPRNKEWEKERRDRLNKTFNELAELLPQHNPSAPAPSKIEILQNSIKLILELHQRLQALNPTDAANNNCENDKGQADTPTAEIVPQAKKKRKYTKKREKKLTATVADSIPTGNADQPEEKLPNPVRDCPEVVKAPKTPSPIHILRTGRKTQILLKNRWYKNIRRHILDAYQKKSVKFRRKRLSKVQIKPKESTTDISQSISSPKQVQIPGVTLSKPTFEEIHDLIPNATNQINDLFVSLPHVASSSGLLSPTEAFLMTFPVVSGSLIGSGGKVNEQMDVSEPGVKETASSVVVSRSSASLAALPRKKSFEGVAPFPRGLPLLDTHFNVAEKLSTTFTFALTASTGSHSLNTSSPSTLPERSTNRLAVPLQPPPSLNHHYMTPMASNCPATTKMPLLLDMPGGSSLSTDTKTTNSWSYNNNNKKYNFPNNGPPHGDSDVQGIVPADYANVQPFSFSLTNTTTAQSPVMAPHHPPKVDHHLFNPVSQAASSTAAGSMIFDSYNTTSFNSFPNSFLGPPAPDSCQYGTNPFSFQLTTSVNSQPLSSTSAITPYPANGNTAGQAQLKRTGKSAEPRRDKQRERKGSAAGDKKRHSAADLFAHNTNNNNKSHVNWMTDSTRNYHIDDHHHHYHHQANSYLAVPPPTIATATGQPATTPSVFRGDDFNQKSDIFFAHPPGEDRFLWNQPPVDTTRNADFNVSQLLPPSSFVQPDNTALFANQNTGSSSKQLPGQPVKQANNVAEHYQPNANFSVSNLVGTGIKKYAHSGLALEVNSKFGSTSLGPSWNLQPPTNNATKSTSKNYSAEALIGCHQTYASVKSDHHFKTPSAADKRQNLFSIQDCINPVAQSNNHLESDAMEFNYNLLNGPSGQFGPPPPPTTARTESGKGHQPVIAMQEPANPYPFFSNDFMQQPRFPGQTLPLLSDHSHTQLKGSNKQPAGRLPGSGQKTKSYYEESTSLIMPPNEPAPGTTLGHSGGGGHQSNYDLGSASSYFTAPAPSQPHPPPFLINSDPYNYSDNCKLSQAFVAAQPPPPIDFHCTTTPSGPASNFSTNYLPNFNLSSICPEINNSIT